MNIKTQKGFTLIELLVVVAIIGMLASTVLVGLTPARKMGRDARRVSDIRNIQNVLELYYSRYGVYPGVSSGGTPGSCSNAMSGTTGWTALGTCLTFSPPGEESLIKKLANDPSVGSSYEYEMLNSGKNYLMRAKLESASNDILKDDIDDGTMVGGVSVTGCGSTTLPENPPRYCVTNP